VEDLFARRMSEGFAAAMREAVMQARKLFTQGLPLMRMVDRRLAVDISLFSRGGMRVLDKIERQGFDVLSRRPVVSTAERIGLLLGTLARVAVSRAAA
jgi:phytoene/squalene synthetase